MIRLLVWLYSMVLLRELSRLWEVQEAEIIKKVVLIVLHRHGYRLIHK